MKNARPWLISVIRSTNAFSECGGAEHERVDADAGAGAAQHLAQRRLDRLGHRRVAEEHVAARRDVRRRFAVGDHDDLLGAVLAAEQLAGERQAVVHVGAVHVVPARLGDLLGLDTRAVSENTTTPR